MENYVIEVNDVKRKFKTYEVKTSGSFVSKLFRKKVYKKALDGVSFKIGEGEIVALLGRNGSGKSTIVKILSGILHPDSGSIRVLGLDPWDDRIKLASQVGVVLGAHGQLFWNLPASDAFNFMKGVYEIKDSDFRKRLKYFLDLLNLKEVFRRQVRQLSLGEQMKCNFVSSVLHMPRIVFLDEPTIGVDIPSKTALRNAIMRMRSEHKTTFLITTHIVEDINIAERVILLNKGKLVFDGSRTELEQLFGDKRHVDLHLSKTSSINYRKYGKVLEKKNDIVKLEVDRPRLKSRAFLSLLNSDDVIDYKVTEPGLNFILSKFYAKMDRDGKRRGHVRKH